MADRPRVASGPPLLAVLGLLLASSAALAGPVDPGLRFETLGALGEPGALRVLPVPGEQRALLLHADGRLELSAGDGLASSVLLDLGLGEQGGVLLGAAWQPGSGDAALFLTLLSPEGNFRVARLPVAGTRPAGPLETVWEHPRRTGARERLGGGIAFADDGTLFVGIGDFAIPSRADTPGYYTGVVLRMTAEGQLPAAPLGPNPGASFVVAYGLRDPALFALGDDGPLWLLDHGGAGGDELNAMTLPTASIEDFGWGAEEILGDAAPGTLPPLWHWSAASTDRPSSLALLDDEGLAPGRVGNPVLASAGSGRVSEWDAAQAQWIPGPLLDPEPGDPAGYAALTVWPGGDLLFLEPDASAWRLRRPSVPRLQTSGRESLAPFLIRKLGSSGELELSYERVHETTEAGVYAGGLEDLHRSGYTHGEQPDLALPASGPDGSARQVTNLDESGLPDFPGGSYYLIGTAQANGDWFHDHGDNSFEEPRPGCATACEPWDGSDRKVGFCAPDVEFELVLQGDDLIGPIRVPNDMGCRVYTLTFSTAWCGPSWFLSMELEPFYREHAADGYVHLDVLFEGDTGQLPDLETLETWRDDYGLSFPILADEERRAWSRYRETGSFPETFVIDRFGEIRDWFLGADPEGIKSRVLELLAE